MTKPRTSIGARRNPATEAAILDAAAEILGESGFDGLSMEAVARRAKAGKATLYRWWPTRGALLMAAYQRQKQMGDYPDTGGLETDVAAVLTQLFAHWSRPEGQLFRHIIAAAQARAAAQGITGKAVTPFLLSAIFEATEGASLTANIALVRNNARLAAAIARELVQ